MTPPAPIRRPVRALRVALACGLLAAGAPAWSQEPPVAPGGGTGSIRGRVFDGETGAALAGVSVIVVAPAEAGGEKPRQQVALTDAEGAFEFAAVEAGTYRVEFVKSGYRASTMTDVVVEAGRSKRADFPLPRLPAATADQILELDAFVVEASTAEAMTDALELRMEADQHLNIMSAEDLSKFAASDVADALKRVAGVNVVGGQFAIIRGLEDRYNSTLYNGAPVPSPDPDKQSVQLDLFPNDVVGNLVVSKTFAPELPSNTSGGGIDIVTHEYPEELELRFSSGTGFSTNATDRFLRYDRGNPMGEEVSGNHVIESESAASIGGRRSFFERELRFKAAYNHEVDFDTAEGWQQGREPRRAEQRNFPRPPTVTRSGDLSLGQLSLSDARFDLTESERAEQDTAYLGFGLDLDREGSHRIDSSLFYTKKETEVVQLRENGYFPNLDYSRFAAAQQAGEAISDAFFEGAATPNSWVRSVRQDPGEARSRGPYWSDSFQQSQSFDTERDLRVYQVNGDHGIELIDGLHLRWAANHARTTQQEAARGARYFFEGNTERIPTAIPVTVESIENGAFYANNGLFDSANDIEETQDFARVDADYTFDPHQALELRVSGGLWYERADRDVSSSFLQTPTVEGRTQFAVSAATPLELGETIFQTLDQTGGVLGGVRDSTNESSRRIRAWNAGAKATLLDRLDLLGGVRGESIFIESLNDPFTGEFDPFDGAPRIYPSAYLLFDRRDNPSRPFETPTAQSGTVFNDEILGIDVPIDPETGFVDLIDRASIESLVDGEIDETYLFPSVGFAYRPLDGLTLRGAYSQTVARPSFREMGYYISVEPASDDLVIGNPQLGLSEVTSYDARIEYLWGDRSDLAAVSVFYKTIQDPIESILVRDPTNFEASSNALFRTFFNNPNEGTLWGIEAEARKSFDFVGLDFARYLSLGGNFTYIDATVGRTDAELARSMSYFGVMEGERARFDSLDDERRLFGQPEWIANLDLSFDHPEWGTKVTLAFFAISDVLDAAGSASIAPDGSVFAFTLDRYVDSFHQLDLVVSQKWRVDLLRGDLVFKASAKNLTDSKRRIVYDPEQTDDEIPERAFRIGRDLSFSITYSLSF
jgi:outer membrane receptor protein involved in Fe transport